MGKRTLIECNCGSCRLVLADDKPMCHLMCACVDCRRSMEYLRDQGGFEPISMPNAYYMTADILEVHGLKDMSAFKIRRNGLATRVYCVKCFSVLGVHHPLMKNNVFANWPEYCSNKCDLTMPLKAYIFMNDYVGDVDDIRNDIPYFGALTLKEEFKRFMEIEEVARSFTVRSSPFVGQPFTSVIKKLGEVTIAF